MKALGEIADAVNKLQIELPIDFKYDNEKTIGDATRHFDDVYTGIRDASAELCRLLPNIIKDVPNMSDRTKRTIGLQYVLVDGCITYKMHILAEVKYATQKKCVELKKGKGDTGHQKT